MKRIVLGVAGCLLGGGLFWSAVAQQPAPQAATYKPKLAEIMLMLQVRHTKLSLAGEAQNWSLAEFQLEEIKEAFEDAEKYYPTFKDIPIKGMIESVATPAIAAVEKAVARKSRADFVRAFGELTQACNSCHQGANFGFVVIQRPATSSYPNQSFAPSRN